MAIKADYERVKAELLHDRKICVENRALFRKFFEFEEYKLKRLNGTPTLDEHSYKTVFAYVYRLRTVNAWFKNKSWSRLTKADIKQVYDDLEDGKILTKHGRPFRDKQTYYRKILRGKPFELAGKRGLVREVMEFVPPEQKREVRFIREDNFRRIVEVTTRVEQRCFLWLCWDIGENANAILQLRKRDCMRQLNEHTKDPEYLINLRQDILKRSRKSRSELTNYRETVGYLDTILKKLQPDDLIFNVGPHWGKKLFERAVMRTGVKCIPHGQRPTLKDLRSSMACDLLSKGWSTDEVNARLGHTPSSREIDEYANFLAIGRSHVKRKVQEHETRKLRDEVAEMREREKEVLHTLARVKLESEKQFKAVSAWTIPLLQFSLLMIEQRQGRVPEKLFVRRLLKTEEILRRAVTDHR